MAQRVGTYIPFTYWNMVFKSIDKRTESILDVGCADGDMMAFIRHRCRVFTVGLDMWPPYVEDAKNAKRHDSYVLADARSLPFEEKCFDTVLFLETIEHLGREEGTTAIAEAERVARRQVIISTPVSFVTQGAYGGNPHQEHRSYWTPEDMAQRGYRVIGIGIPNNWLVSKVRNGLPRLVDTLSRGRQSGNQRRALRSSLKLADFLLRLPYYLLPGPFVYALPKLGGHMICVKRIGSSGRGLTELWRAPSKR